MTSEDAILCLKGIKNYGRDTFTLKSQGDWQESLDMAIETLEKELEKEYLFESLCDDLKKAQAEIERFNENSKAEKVAMLDKIRTEILDNAFSVVNPRNTYEYINVIDLDSIYEILDKYRGEIPKSEFKTYLEINLNRLKDRMKDRDEDNGGEPLNAVDRGYHLAYEHLCEEIDKLLKEN